jgi:hypothetical protein
MILARLTKPQLCGPIATQRSSAQTVAGKTLSRCPSGFSGLGIAASRATKWRGQSARRRNAEETSRPGLDQAFADGPHSGLRPVGDTDFAQDVLHVFLDGFVADVQRQGDFLVRQAER